MALETAGTPKPSNPFLFTIAGNDEMCDLLVNHGANVNLHTSSGQTPLHVSATNGNLKFAAALIKHGAVVDSSDLNGVTPLQLAVFEGNASNEQIVTCN